MAVFGYKESLIKRKVASGILFFGARRVVFQVILTGANIILIKILGSGAVEVYGVFAMISFVALTVGGLCNLGLGTALVQSQDETDSSQKKAIFTILMIATIFFGIGVNLLAPTINSLFRDQLGRDGLWGLRLLAFFGVVTSVGAISGITLERKMDFKRLVVADLFGLLFTQIFIIFLTARGLGLLSFVYGNLVGGILTSVTLFLLSPWEVGFNFKFKEVGKLLKFGVDYEIKNLANLINTSIVPLWVGFVSGPVGVGFVNWSWGIRQVGLAPVEVVEKVMVPTLSRAVNDGDLVKQLVERMLRLSAMLSLPILGAIIVLGRGIIDVIYTSIWQTGFVALVLACLHGGVIIVGTIFTTLLIALGKVRQVRNIFVLNAVVCWALSIPMVLIWGFSGVVIATIVASSTYFLAYLQVNKEVTVKVWPNFGPFLIYTLLSMVVMHLLLGYWPIRNMFGLIGVASAGALVYWLLVMARQGDLVKQDFASFLRVFRR